MLINKIDVKKFLLAHFYIYVLYFYKTCYNCNFFLFVIYCKLSTQMKRMYKQKQIRIKLTKFKILLNF